MTTNSINKNIDIKEKDKAENLVNALEKAEEINKELTEKIKITLFDMLSAVIKDEKDIDSLAEYFNIVIKIKLLIKDEEFETLTRGLNEKDSMTLQIFNALNGK